MSRYLVWAADPVAEEDQFAYSGDVIVGQINLLGSGRWCFEIVRFPGMYNHRDALRGFCKTEDEARSAVQRLWELWLEKAALDDN